MTDQPITPEEETPETPQAEVATPEVETPDTDNQEEQAAAEQGVKAVDETPKVGKETNEDYLKELDKIMTPKELENFNPDVVEMETLDQLEKANQLKYVDAILAAGEENKLIEDNAKDVRELSEDIRAEATKHAMNIENTADPDYFEKFSVKDELLGPIQQIRVMIQKAHEVKIKGWKVEYRERLVKKIREMKEIKKAAMQSATDKAAADEQVGSQG